MAAKTVETVRKDCLFLKRSDNKGKKKYIINHLSPTELTQRFTVTQRDAKICERSALIERCR